MEESATRGPVSIRPVERDSWEDFEAFFEASGKLRYCWCMAWRTKKEERRQYIPCRPGSKAKRLKKTYR